MKRGILTPFLVFSLTALACGLPGAVTAPTPMPLPPTPIIVVPSPLPPADTAPPPIEPPPPASFDGTWQGPDPDDGSSMKLTLAQSGNQLSGTYEDSYSPNVPPPGYAGTVTGTLLSPTTGQLTLQLKRHDGNNITIQANISLSDDNSTLTIDITSHKAGPWVLIRQ
jgi:hypothetical protein